MKIAVSRPSMRLLKATILCLALVISGMPQMLLATSHADHAPGIHAGERMASAHEALGHDGHHMPATHADAECCEPEDAAASGCHVAPCCPAELQGSELPLLRDHARVACGKLPGRAAVRTVDSSLPERPPRLS